MSISIIIPTYNSTRYFESTLASVSAQTRLPDEVLIVDDRSTDGTVEMAKQWRSKQPFEVRILENRISHEGKPGPAAGRQTGLLETSCDMIALLDHDDEMLPSHLELTERALLIHPDVDLCFGDAMEFNEKTGRQWSLFTGKGADNINYLSTDRLGLRLIADPLFRTLMQGSYIPTASNLWRRETALRAGGFRPWAGTCDDVLFFLGLSRLGGVAYYPFPIARKRSHGANLSDERYALQHCWNYLEVLRRIVDSGDWNLSHGEAIIMEERMKELEQEILYHASREGVRSYLKNRRRLGPGKPLATALGAARAMVHSTRLKVAKTSS
jgi:glycosyltransferase involved in cell wall biosynthesis